MKVFLSLKMYMKKLCLKPIHNGKLIIMIYYLIGTDFVGKCQFFVLNRDGDKESKCP